MQYYSSPFYVSGNSSLSIGDGLIWTKEGGLEIKGKVSANVFDLIDQQDLVAASFVTNTSAVDLDTGAAEDSLVFAPLNFTTEPYTRISWNEAGNLWLYSSPDGVEGNYNRLLVSPTQVWATSATGVGSASLGVYEYDFSGTGVSIAEMLYKVDNLQFHSIKTDQFGVYMAHRDAAGSADSSITINDTGVYFWEQLKSSSNGTAANPAYTFASDTNTGIYRAAENELTFSSGGVWKINIRSTDIQLNDDLDANSNVLYGISTLHTDYIDTSNGNAGTPAIHGTDLNTGIYFDPGTNQQVVLSSNGTWRITAKTTGAGVNGTLNVYGGITTTSTIDTQGSALNLGNGSIDECNTIDLNEIYASNGSTSDPPYTFTSNQQTGMYAYNSSTVGFTAANAFAGLMTAANTSLKGAYATSTAGGEDCRVTNSSGRLARVVSSLAYKKDVERADYDRMVNVVDNAEVIWYRSQCEEDAQGWSWYGLGAEPLADIDPHFATWGISPDCDCDFGEEDVEDPAPPSAYPHNHTCRIPISVDYRALTMPLMVAASDLRKRMVKTEEKIEALEAENTELKARLERIEAALDI